MNKVDILFLSESTTNNNGSFWMGSEGKRTIIVHSRNTAIALIGIWTDLWLESGIQNWRTDRTTKVLIKNYHLMSVYWPLWHYGIEAINEYRHAIEEQIAMGRHDEWLIIWGDHYASVGKLELKSSSTRARGKYGYGPSYKAGNDQIAWCELNSMSWVNSLMRLTDGGTWFHQGYGRCNELDGFLIKQEQLHRIVKKTRTVKENSFSDRRPKELITRTVTRPRILTTSNKKVSIDQ